MSHQIFNKYHCDNQSIKYSHLKRNLSQTPSTFDVETEDGQSHVKLILNGLFACIELLPLVDVLTTSFTPANNQRGNVDDTTVTGLIYKGQKVQVALVLL